MCAQMSRADYDDREQMENYVLMSERACIVANSIKDAIDLSFTVN